MPYDTVCNPMHVHVDPGGSAATERNRSFTLESADAGVDGEVLETRRDVQDVGKSVETFPTTSIEETLPGRAPERPETRLDCIELAKEQTRGRVTLYSTERRENQSSK